MATLYVVATPIGNLADITARALEVLRSVDLIACEDTRHSRILLDRYEIRTPTVSYHQHSSIQKIDWLVEQLGAGRDIALITDAGTPGISDPGGLLVKASSDQLTDLVVVPIPGPSSALAALSVAGFPADKFIFLGFLPKKKGRQTLLRALASNLTVLSVETVVFFESAQRIHQTIKDLNQVFGQNSGKISVLLGRELTKKFEQLWRGDLVSAIEQTVVLQKGEFVVVLHFER